MTVFPQSPVVKIDEKSGIATLLETHVTQVKLGFGRSLVVSIGSGFKTDGASVPREELEKSRVVKKACKIISKKYPGKDYRETLDYLIGTPFEMPRFLAAIVHDALYTIKWKFRWICDRVYRKILSSLGYDETRKDIEYSGIRLFGWKNWEAVTDLERDRTRRIVKVRIVRNGKVQKLLEKLKSEEST
jgi:hypothetical protein